MNLSEAKKFLKGMVITLIPGKMMKTLKDTYENIILIFSQHLMIC